VNVKQKATHCDRSRVGTFDISIRNSDTRRTKSLSVPLGPGIRPGLQSALNVDRSLRDLIATVTMLEERGIGFKSLIENIDTTTSEGKLIFISLARLLS
jgi:hypothetical protein